MVQWDTSDHDWLRRPRGEVLSDPRMISDATSELTARFVAHDSTGENMRLRKSVGRHGRPVAFYTDKASLFQSARKIPQIEAVAAQTRRPLPPTQIGRALRSWVSYGSRRTPRRPKRPRVLISNCPGPAGQGAACGGAREDPGTSQPVSTRRVRAVVEPASETAPRNPRCSSSAGARARSGCDLSVVETRQSHPGLHDSPGAIYQIGARRHSRRMRKRACGGSSGQFAEGSLSRSLSGGEPMPAAAQAHRCRLNPAQIVLAPGPVRAWQQSPEPTLLSFRNTPMEGRPHRSRTTLPIPWKPVCSGQNRPSDLRAWSTPARSFTSSRTRP